MVRVMRGKIYKINDATYIIEVIAEKEILGPRFPPFLPPCEVKFVEVFDHRAVVYEEIIDKDVIVFVEEKKDGRFGQSRSPLWQRGHINS